MQLWKANSRILQNLSRLFLPHAATLSVCTECLQTESQVQRSMCPNASCLPVHVLISLSFSRRSFLLELLILEQYILSIFHFRPTHWAAFCLGPIFYANFSRITVCSALETRSLFSVRWLLSADTALEFGYWFASTSWKFCLKGQFTPNVIFSYYL